jgi:polyphosphate kinase 2
MTKKQKDKKKSKKDADVQPGTDERKPKLKRREYEEKLEELQIELVKLQRWVKHSGARVVVVFEGRDAAGKGGAIKRITERVSSRVFRVVALPAPSDREKSQLYVQRYIVHMPAAGEVVLFDRSWYNRAGVEPVLGFCTSKQHEKFLRYCDRFEHGLVDDGIILIKYWLSVSADEQEQRFRARIEDPLRQWKLSPTDLESVRRWYEYSVARDAMLMSTDTDFAPWYIVKSDDKRRARLNCIRHLLSCIPYEELPYEQIEIPQRDRTHEYDDVASLESRRFVPEHY